jgi:excisionase family DNA binding protein
MDCVRLKLNSTSTTIVVRDGWLIIETTDCESLNRELESATANRIFNVAEVSEKTGFTPNAVRAWLKSGKLTGRRVGKEYRIHERDLGKFLEGVPEPEPGKKMRIGRRMPVKF